MPAPNRDSTQDGPVRTISIAKAKQALVGKLQTSTPKRAEAASGSKTNRDQIESHTRVGAKWRSHSRSGPIARGSESGGLLSPGHKTCCSAGEQPVEGGARRRSVYSTSSAWYTKPAQTDMKAASPWHSSGSLQTTSPARSRKNGHVTPISPASRSGRRGRETSSQRSTSRCKGPAARIQETGGRVYQEMPSALEADVQRRVWGRFVAPLDRPIGSVDSAHSFSESGESSRREESLMAGCVSPILADRSRSRSRSRSKKEGSNSSSMFGPLPLPLPEMPPPMQVQAGAKGSRGTLTQALFPGGQHRAPGPTSPGAVARRLPSLPENWYRERFETREHSNCSGGSGSESRSGSGSGAKSSSGMSCESDAPGGTTAVKGRGHGAVTGAGACAGVGHSTLAKGAALDQSSHQHGQAGGYAPRSTRWGVHRNAVHSGSGSGIGGVGQPAEPAGRQGERAGSAHSGSSTKLRSTSRPRRKSRSLRMVERRALEQSGVEGAVPARGECDECPHRGIQLSVIAALCAPDAGSARGESQHGSRTATTSLVLHSAALHASEDPHHAGLGLGLGTTREEGLSSDDAEMGMRFGRETDANCAVELIVPEEVGTEDVHHQAGNSATSWSHLKEQEKEHGEVVNGEACTSGGAVARCFDVAEPPGLVA